MFKVVTKTAYYCDDEPSVCPTEAEQKFIAEVGEVRKVACIKYIRATHGVGLKFAIDIVNHIQQNRKWY